MKKTIKIEITQEEVNSILLEHLIVEYPDLPIELSIDGIVQGTFGYELSKKISFDNLKTGDLVTITRSRDGYFGEKGDKGVVTDVRSIDSITVRLSSGRNKGSQTDRPFSELGNISGNKIIKLDAEPNPSTLFVPTL